MLIVAHPILRQTLKDCLEAEADLVVIGEAADGLAGVALALQLQPQVVITDLLLPKLHGFEVIRQIHDNNPDIHIVVYSLYDDLNYQQHCLNIGACRYIAKTTHKNIIIDTVRQLAVHNTR